MLWYLWPWLYCLLVRYSGYNAVVSVATALLSPSETLLANLDKWSDSQILWCLVIRHPSQVVMGAAFQI